MARKVKYFKISSRNFNISVMDAALLNELLQKVKEGTLSPETALEKLRSLPFEAIDSSHVDHHRALRQGIPEVVFAEGKTVDEVLKISRAIYKKSKKLLITRVDEDIRKALRIRGAKYYPRSRVIMAGGIKSGSGLVLVVTAGTSDIAVAEEASLTASFLGSRVETVYDVGVAGIHRLFAYMDLIREARVIVVVAGMEGALPSVVGGIADSVVIGVPASTGYGTSFGGLTALFAMLNSCVPGIAVVNIDNGFGAGCLAHRINTGTK
ncbi:MAG: 1-(5-phosphoribosyl)-5-amino-4-imidazole-carboxylate carboxylase [bacterium]|nr:MAG: 1-(5-phosphoribosyl)-5-amino-4-imidazole-carboxylate carboxylase [bacterium]